MRLRSKIRDLKLQHAQLQEMKEAQQQQLRSSVEQCGSDSTHGQAACCQQLHSQQDSSIPGDRSIESPSLGSAAAESVCESMSEANTSDTGCGDSCVFSSHS